MNKPKTLLKSFFVINANCSIIQPKSELVIAASNRKSQGLWQSNATKSIIPRSLR